MEGSWNCTRDLQTVPHFFSLEFLVRSSHLFDSIFSSVMCNNNVFLPLQQLLSSEMNIAVSDIDFYCSVAEIAEGKNNKTKHSIQEYLLHLKRTILVDKNLWLRYKKNGV